MASAEQESNVHLNVSAANRFIAGALGGEEGKALKDENAKLKNKDTDNKGSKGSKKSPKKTSETPGSSTKKRSVNADGSSTPSKKSKKKAN